ncbi:MAG: hypothetical protein ACI4N3_02835 [Alphaproteobacteria bacterium]
MKNMKNKYILTVLASLSASLLNNTAKAELFMCKACPAGTYANNNECITCPAGSYCVDGIKHECPEGYLSQEGSNSSLACVNCSYTYYTGGCFTDLSKNRYKWALDDFSYAHLSHNSWIKYFATFYHGDGANGNIGYGVSTAIAICDVTTKQHTGTFSIDSFNIKSMETKKGHFVIYNPSLCETYDNNASNLSKVKNECKNVNLCLHTIINNKIYQCKSKAAIWIYD